jgi:hypothetical protein
MRCFKTHASTYWILEKSAFFRSTSDTLLKGSIHVQYYSTGMTAGNNITASSTNPASTRLTETHDIFTKVAKHELSQYLVLNEAKNTLGTEVSLAAAKTLCEQRICHKISNTMNQR